MKSCSPDSVELYGAPGSEYLLQAEAIRLHVADETREVQTETGKAGRSRCRKAMLRNLW